MSVALGNGARESEQSAEEGHGLRATPGARRGPGPNHLQASPGETTAASASTLDTWPPCPWENPLCHVCPLPPTSSVLGSDVPWTYVHPRWVGARRPSRTERALGLRNTGPCSVREEKVPVLGRPCGLGWWIYSD